MAPKAPAAAKKDPNSNLPPALAAVLAQIQKEFGEGAIMRLGSEGAVAKIPAMRKYAGNLSNGFVTLIGLIAMSGIIYKLIA